MFSVLVLHGVAFVWDDVGCFYTFARWCLPFLSGLFCPEGYLPLFLFSTVFTCSTICGLCTKECLTFVKAKVTKSVMSILLVHLFFSSRWSSSLAHPSAQLSQTHPRYGPSPCVLSSSVALRGPSIMFSAFISAHQHVIVSLCLSTCFFFFVGPDLSHLKINTLWTCSTNSTAIWHQKEHFYSHTCLQCFDQAV